MEELDEFLMPFAANVGDRLAASVGAESQEPGCRLVRHDQAILLIDDNHSVPETINDGFGVPLLPLGKPGANPQIIEFRTELADKRFPAGSIGTGRRLQRIGSGESHLTGWPRSLPGKLSGYGRDHSRQPEVGRAKDDHAHSPDGIQGKAQPGNRAAHPCCDAKNLQLSQGRHTHGGNRNSHRDPNQASLGFQSCSSEPILCRFTVH